MIYIIDRRHRGTYLYGLSLGGFSLDLTDLRDLSDLYKATTNLLPKISLTQSYNFVILLLKFK